MIDLNCQMDLILYQTVKIILSILKKNMKKISDKPSTQIYVNKIENKVKFKIRNGHSIELLTPETMKLLGST